MTRTGRRVPVTVDRDLRGLLRVIASARGELDVLCRAAAPSGTPAIIDALSHWLYQNWYLTSDGASAQDETGTRDANLPATLRAALPASTRWLAGWTVLETRANGVCVAGRRGMARVLQCGDYASLSRPGVPVMPGDSVAVVECVDWTDWQAGFWTTRSTIGEPSAPLVRLYWSVTAERICVVLRRVAGCLDDLDIRYSLKCPARAGDFARVDSLVIYLERAAWNTARHPLTALAKALRADLRGSTPPLTQRVAFGVACAQDPGPAESFGQTRCRALSPGVLALVDDEHRPGDHVGLLVEQLQKAGIDAARPWMCP